MIIPYYNSIAIRFNDNKVCLDGQSEQLVRDCLTSYLESHRDSKIILNIRFLHPPSDTIIESRAINILHKLLSKLTTPLFEINQTYTLSESTSQLFIALSELHFIDSDSKSPAIAKNLTLLKQYYSKYSSEQQLKVYLKELMIEQVNHQKRLIKYRSAQDIQALVRSAASQISGSISIQSNSSQPGQMLLLFCEGIPELCQDQIVKILDSQPHIDKSCNVNITNQYTIHYLREIALEKVTKLFNQGADLLRKRVASEAKKFGEELMVINNLRAILKEGIRLAEEEENLRAEFKVFVQEMNKKYTNQTLKYLSTFREQLNFQQLQRHHVRRSQSRRVVNIYLSGLRDLISYKEKEDNWIYRNCTKIQKRVRSFLLNKKLYEEIAYSYISQKRQVKLADDQEYAKITTLFNLNQLQKLRHYNKYKHNFSCCTQLLQCQNRANYFEFQPSALFRLIDKVNRAAELVVSIRCLGGCIQIQSIEGRVYQLGVNFDSQGYITEPINQDHKQNRISYSNSIILDQFDSVKSGFSIQSVSTRPSLISKLGSSKSQLTTAGSSLYLKPKIENIIKVAGVDCEFIIDNERLYGRGSNKFGQLGLGQNEYISEFSLVMVSHKIKLVSTDHYHTIAVTSDNKVFHFGKERDNLIQTLTPQQLILPQHFIIKEAEISHDDVVFLTERNKLYSLNQQFIKIAKEIQMQFDCFHLVKTTSVNFQIVYLVGYWINTFDKLKKQQIQRYLIHKSCETPGFGYQSILIEDQTPKQPCLKNLCDLSAILEEQSF